MFNKNTLCYVKKVQSRYICLLVRGNVNNESTNFKFFCHKCNNTTYLFNKTKGYKSIKVNKCPI